MTKWQKEAKHNTNKLVFIFFISNGGNFIRSSLLKTNDGEEYSILTKMKALALSLAFSFPS